MIRLAMRYRTFNVAGRSALDDYLLLMSMAEMFIAQFPTRPQFSRPTSRLLIGYDYFKFTLGYHLRVSYFYLSE